MHVWIDTQYHYIITMMPNKMRRGHFFFTLTDQNTHWNWIEAFVGLAFLSQDQSQMLYDAQRCV